MEAPWSLTVEQTLRHLDVEPARGLDEAEAAARLGRYGPNLVREVPPASAWRILFNQLESLVVALLAAAAVVSLVFGEWVDALAIFAVLLVNTLLGFTAEIRATRSMEALRRLGTAGTRVRRAGTVRVIPARDLVPGDIVLLEGGDVVAADMRLTEASKLKLDESALTGESDAVRKGTDAVAAETPLFARRSMLFKGTALTRGSAEAVVVATGMESELGRIASLVAEADKAVTPLEKRLERLARRLIGVALLLAGVTTVAGILSGKEPFLMIEVGIALAVAAIPEGLPIVATLALARGMWRMARRQVLVRRLSAVEVLGATTVIYCDKTGTLTENRMTVDRVALAGGDVSPAAPDAHAALEIGVLCNNATLSPATGDPLEVALLEAGRAVHLERAALLERHPEVSEEAFDPGTRRMATTHRGVVAVKGAVEAVLDGCALPPAQRAFWLARSVALAAEGLRVLAVARKEPRDGEGPYENLAMVGLLALRDPPRPDVAAAIEECRQARVRVVMVTGDQAETARRIGAAVGIAGEDARVVEGHELAAAGDLRDVALFARVSPEQKLELIAAAQRAGEIVAMTGDGVNDAPALKKADIGVAMGQRGTQVAREAADMVLKDDSFASIVAAIHQGRVIFRNIRQFVLYLLSCNLSEVMIVTGAALVGAPLPLLPLQILFLNLVTDVFPALALAFGEGDDRVMRQPPRPPSEPILTGALWRRLVIHAVTIAIAVMAAAFLARAHLGVRGHAATTISFLTLAFAQLWHVINLREQGCPPWRNDVVRNPWMWAALGLCCALLLLAVYLPAFAGLLRLEPPSADAWLLVLGMSLLPVLIPLILRPGAARRTRQG